MSEDVDPKRVVAFGEVLWDLLPDGRRLGGAPLNFAYRMRCLRDDAIIASRLGRDGLGREAADRLARLGFDSRLIQYDDAHPTGTVPVTLDEHGSPEFTIIPDVAYDYIEPTDALLNAAAGADCVCFGTLVQRKAASRGACRRVLAAAEKALKLLDINLRRDCYTAGTVAESVAHADVLKLNDSEALELTGLLGLPSDGVEGVARRLVERYGLDAVVVTLGGRGALAVTKTGAAYRPGFSVDVVDTVGAGDAFTAGFAHRHLRGAGPEECLEFGNALGAVVATQSGGTAPLRSDDVLGFLRSGPGRVVDPAYG